MRMETPCLLDHPVSILTSLILNVSILTLSPFSKETVSILTLSPDHVSRLTQ